MKKFTFLIPFLICHLLLSASNITGKVTDLQTGEELVGVSIYLKENSKIGTLSGLDGSFVLHGIENNCTLICNYIGYNKEELSVVLTSTETTKLDIKLKQTGINLSDVEIIAGTKNTDFSARSLEKESIGLLNIVSSQSMEISPDINVASILGRVSGVTMERNNAGEGQYAILRGMDKRYNTTLVNGVKISSPDNKQRYIPLDIFPGELLDRLEVSKTQTAEKEGDATGGSINLVMKDATPRLSVSANASVGYNSIFFDQNQLTFNRADILQTTPYEQYGKAYKASMADFNNQFYEVASIQAKPNGIIGLSVGNRVLKKKLGFIVAANYQNTNKGSNSTLFEDEMVQTDSTRAVKLSSKKDRIYASNKEQYGLHAKLDFKFNKNHKIEFYNAYISSSDAQVRQSTSLSFKLYYEPEVGNGDYSYQTRTRLTEQQIFASTLQGEHKLFKKLSINWTGVYSKAELQRPDQAYVNLDNLRSNYVDKIYADADGSTRRWEHNSDQDISGILHLKYISDFNFGRFTWQLGALYREKERDNFYVSYTFKPTTGQVQGVDFNSNSEIDWKLYTLQGSVSPLNYDASEKIIAEYIQTTYNKGKFEAIAGLRAETTDQSYLMYFPNAGQSPTGGQQYMDYLPNVHLKYTPNNKMNCRLSYFRSINRPGFFEIIPYQIINEDYTEYGNPKLEHSVIENFDARWEFFPKPTEQIMVGIFMKDIKSPIEYAYYSINQRQSGYGPSNLGDAKNLGTEIDIIKYFRQFGVKFNYTYTHSAITTPKSYFGKDENGNTKRMIEDQTRPLVGQAAHVSNLSLLYKNTKYGWDVQLAGAYTGDKIVIASHYLNSDYWQKASIQMDASLEKKFGQHFSVFAKAKNLLNTPLTVFIKTHNVYNDKFPLQSATSGETLIQKDYFKQNYLVGIRYKL